MSFHQQEKNLLLKKKNKMGQKSNPTIINLSLKNAEWKFKYIEKNLEESTLLFYKNLEVQNYISNLFAGYGVLVHSCYIEHNNNETNVIILFTNLNSEELKNSTLNFLVNNLLLLNLQLFFKSQKINIKTQNLSKKFEFSLIKHRLVEYKQLMNLLKRFINKPSSKNLIKAIFVVISEKNSSKLLSEIVVNYFNTHKKRHGFILFFLKKTLNYLIPSNLSIIKGVKIIISGRFNGAPRSSKKILKIGSVPIQSFSKKINYNEQTAFTPNGTFGVKVWVCEI